MHLTYYRESDKMTVFKNYLESDILVIGNVLFHGTEFVVLILMSVHWPPLNVGGSGYAVALCRVDGMR